MKKGPKTRKFEICCCKLKLINWLPKGYICLIGILFGPQWLFVFSLNCLLIFKNRKMSQKSRSLTFLEKKKLDDLTIPGNSSVVTISFVPQAALVLKLAPRIRLSAWDLQTFGVTTPAAVMVVRFTFSIRITMDSVKSVLAVVRSLAS